MLKIKHLDRATRFVETCGNPSDEGKPNTHGARAAKILDAQTDAVPPEDAAMVQIDLITNPETGQRMFKKVNT